MTPPVRRWRLVVAYDGSGFHGWAAQEGQPTVAGRLAEAIARTLRLGSPPPIVCAGRTDAGVHATGQVVHVDLPATYGGDLARAVNRQTAPSVVVVAAAPAPAGFDARRSARWRHYRYLVDNAPTPDPLLAPLAWHVAEPLDLRAMAAACDPMVGEHDFRAFCRRVPGTPSDQPITRRVLAAGWRVLPAGAGAATDGVDGTELAGEAHVAGLAHLGDGRRLLRFDVVATSFCHQMVRSVVAVTVAAGRRRASAATVVGLLVAGSRAGTPGPAPAHGLCLVGVGYDPGAAADTAPPGAATDTAPAGAAADTAPAGAPR